MFWAVASVKGGVGTSVIAAAIAERMSRDRRVVLIDASGDQADLLGVEAAGPGVGDWLADDAADDGSAERLVVEVLPNLGLLPVGERKPGDHVSPDRASRLTNLFPDPVAVVADLGVIEPGAFHPLQVMWASATRRTLVLRACYLALCRAQRLPLDPDDLVEVVEGGRALRTLDVEAVLGRPVTNRLPVDPAIARAADAGLLLRRPPRALRRLATALVTPPPVIEAA